MNDRSALFGGSHATIEMGDPPVAANEAYEDESYCAWKDTPHRGPSIGLCLYYANGTIELYNYSYFIKAICTSHKSLSICFNTDIITLKGRHLDRIVQTLNLGRVSELYEFHAGKHEEPPAHEPLIAEMRVQSIQEAARMRSVA